MPCTILVKGRCGSRTLVLVYNVKLFKNRGLRGINGKIGVLNTPIIFLNAHTLRKADNIALIIKVQIHKCWFIW